MEKRWIENIHDSIKDFSDLERQKILWLGLDAKYASSFNEDMNLLFDSFCFEEFIIRWDTENLNKNLANEFYSFKTLLKSYERKKSDKAILEDPAWNNIVEKAKYIIEIWNINDSTINI